MSEENYELRSDKFNLCDLEKVEPPKCPALLKSGGPILDVLDVDDEGWAHCQWDRWIDGVKEVMTGPFKVECLYRLVPFVLSQNDQVNRDAAKDVPCEKAGSASPVQLFVRCDCSPKVDYSKVEYTGQPAWFRPIPVIGVDGKIVRCVQPNIDLKTLQSELFDQDERHRLAIQICCMKSQDGNDSIQPTYLQSLHDELLSEYPWMFHETVQCSHGTEWALQYGGSHYICLNQ